MQQELGGWEAFLGLEEEENYGIFVLFDLVSNKSLDEQLKLLGFAFELKEELGHPVSVVLAGDVREDHIQRIKKYPVSEVHVKKCTNQEEALSFLEKFINEKKPLVLAGGVKSLAKDIFPYLAQKSGEGYLGGGEHLSISPEDRKVIVKRKIYGGLLVETVKNTRAGVQFVTLRTDNAKSPEEQEIQELEVREW